MTGVNGRVDGLNRDVFTTLQNIKSRNQGSSALKEADARELSTAINKDGKVDAAEADLLVELTQDRSRAISISAQKSSNFAPGDLTFATASGQARQMLQETLTPTARLNQLLNQGPEGFKELTNIYQRSPADADRVVNFLSDKASAAWADSRLTNGYAPLRGMISNAYSSINQLQGQENTDGRWMLHRAVAQIDRNADGSNGAIPDFLYNWIRPGGVL